MLIKTFRIVLPDVHNTDGSVHVDPSILVTAPSISIAHGALVVWDDEGCIRKAFAPGYWKSFEEVSA
jgi:hypothetical protein